MKVLVVGSGGREHALAWKIQSSPRVTEVVVSPGNPGMSNVARVVPGGIKPADLLGLAKREEIDFTIVGPEAPLVAGVVDMFKQAGHRIFGVSGAAAQLEGSKVFAKSFMARHGIPTAQYRSFNDPDKALHHIDRVGAPVVVKDSGLAAGKGVTVAETEIEARTAIRRLFEHGPREIVIEELLRGQEVSLHLLADGRSYKILAVAQDYKQAYDGDVGPMTGGMGTVAPVTLLAGSKLKEVERLIIRPTLDGCRQEGMPFRGVMFIGLMVDGEGAKVLEYNVRFGDPETQVLCPLLESDLVPLLEASADGDLEGLEPMWSSASAACVVMAAAGYPGEYRNDIPITLPDVLPNEELLFHAGTKKVGGKTVSAGGRVLNVVFQAATLAEAVKGAYAGVERIGFPNAHFRTDIGSRVG
jgi:phosphoribosylamine--glycine ligase